MKFDYGLDFKRIDFRERPDLYRIGRGEQGVLLVEPYKSEILVHWRFRTPAEARRSAATIFRMFRAYGRKRDFVVEDQRLVAVAGVERFATHADLWRLLSAGLAEPYARYAYAQPGSLPGRLVAVWVVTWIWSPV